jgi:hypothetical protein
MLKTRQISPSEEGNVESQNDSESSKPAMPYRFKTPSYPPPPAPDAIAPPTVSHGEFGGVQAKDKGKYLDSRGVNEAAPVSGQGTPGYANPNQVSMVALVPVVVAILALF